MRVLVGGNRVTSDQAIKLAARRRGVEILDVLLIGQRQGHDQCGPALGQRLLGDQPIQPIRPFSQRRHDDLPRRRRR